jgi:YesN/AraC family two-component response regulator
MSCIAEQLLRNHRTVAEVANQISYTHLGHFAATFKRQFGSYFWTDAAIFSGSLSQFQ